MTFSALATLKLKAMAKEGPATTGRSYDEAYGLFAKYLEHAGLKDDIREFTPANLEGFKDWYLGRKRVSKTSSLNNRLAALASLGKWGSQNPPATGKPGHRFYLDENPMIRVARPKKNKTAERHLYKDEIKAMLAVEALPNEKLALAFLFHTQLRASAAVNAKVRDLSLDGELVKLSVVEKGNKPDTFVLPAELAEPLIASLRQREAGSDETLLVNNAGKPYNKSTLSEMVARMARRAGIMRIVVRAHLFARHSPASLAGQKGASVFEIAAMLRHSDISTARKYVHGVSGDTARTMVRDLVLG